MGRGVSLNDDLIIPKIVNSFPILYGTQKFTFIFRNDLQFFSLLSPINSSTSFQVNYLRYISILSFHLRLGILSGLFSSDFLTKIHTESNSTV